MAGVPKAAAGAGPKMDFKEMKSEPKVPAVDFKELKVRTYFTSFTFALLYSFREVLWRCWIPTCMDWSSACW